MHYRHLLLAAASVCAASQDYGTTAFPAFRGNPFEKLTLSAKGIKASFIPYGARLTNLYVSDKNGKMQDVVLGYDSGKDYLNDTETAHTYFGAVVGRYANRIKNGTFTVDGKKSHIVENEHHGEDTLHGGSVGYDQRNWTIASLSGNSVTFYLYDHAFEGFPGDVLNIATYTLTDEPAWVSRLVSIPLNEATPIMLANHVYWNLGAFVNKEALKVLNNTLHMPYADRLIGIDGNEVPTGAINMTNGTAYDFQAPGKTIGKDLFTLSNSCGTGCVGYDNAFILDRPRYSAPDDPQLSVLDMYSPETGIKMDLQTNQQGLQIYTCDGVDSLGAIKAKSGQQHIHGVTSGYEKYGCIVIETQDVRIQAPDLCKHG